MDTPLEWTRGLIEIDCNPAEWQQVRILRNGTPMSVFVSELAGKPRVLAEWPLSGAGTFAMDLSFLDGSWREKQLCTIAPRKLGPSAVESLVDELQQRLPASIAISLQRAGALAGIEIVSPQETTLAGELQRLERAVKGTADRAGISEVLPLLARHPYQVLRAFEKWADREHARRVDPSRLVQAFVRAGNLDQDLLPLLVPERPVSHSVDTYENRLVKAFYSQVNVRLRLLAAALRRRSNETLADEASALLARLAMARRTAGFLDDVAELREPPGRVTMVLLKRSDYRAAFEGFVEFRRRALVRLAEPAVDTPVESLPFLYQTWGALEVLAAVVDLAADLGYQVRRQRLCWRRAGELWVQLLRDGQPAVVLTHPLLQRTVKLVPQRTYGTGGGDLHSVSFKQVPDVAVEVSTREHTEIYLFDPKYKLDTEEIEGEDLHAKPKKLDIDAMHSYRDSIRNNAGKRVVRYAAILYPGPTQTYTSGLAALRAQPEATHALRAAIRDVLRRPFQQGCTPTELSVARTEF